MMSGRALVGRLLSAFAIVMAAETSVLACSPGDGVYDKDEKNALVVRALVTSFDRETTADRICFNATYEVREIFVGKFAGPIDVSTCASATGSDDGDTDELRLETDVLGWVQGAEVLVGFTTEPPLKGATMQPQPVGAFRYLAPSCWGPLHYRLDKLTDEERSELIAQFRTGFKNPQ